MIDKNQRKILKKMKFISDQDGIMTRYLRERNNWRSHIQQCQDFITGAFKDPALKTVAVLGSGWLLDLPLDHLAERFDDVLLVDIHHPPQIRKKLEDYPNVHLQELDISGGGIDFAWKLAALHKGHIDPSSFGSFDPQTPSLQIEPDALISLNILNQLDILIVDYLMEKYRSLGKEDLKTFRRIIQQFHIQWITQKPGCLISDIIEEDHDPQGEVTRHDLLHTDLPESKRTEQWIWDFDLSGFYHRNRSTKMQVRALEW